MIRTYTIILAFLLSFSLALSDEIENLKRNLPQLMANAGTEYYLTFHPNWDLNDRLNATAEIYLMSPIETEVTLEIKGMDYSVTETVLPNKANSFVLHRSLCQMYIKLYDEAPQEEQVWQGRAIHIKANTPIVVMGCSRQGFTTESYMPLPISMLDKEYVIATGTEIVDTSLVQPLRMTQYTSIIGVHDNTTVDFILGGTNSTTTPGGMKIGELHQKVLNAGDVWLIPAIGDTADLSGSIVRASLPVSVISGGTCANIPTEINDCNYLISQELPTKNWGKEYMLTPIYGRTYNSFVKVFAKEDNTTIYRDGDFFGFIPKSGGIINEAYLMQRADFNTNRPIVFTADKPISITQYNTGSWDDNTKSAPFQMSLFPNDLFVEQAILMIPSANIRISYHHNYVNVVFQSDDGEIPEDIEIVYEFKNEFIVEKLKENALTTQKFQHSIDGKDWYVSTFRLPKEQRMFTISGKNKMGVYQYGFNELSSYGMSSMISLPPATFDTTAPKIEYSIDCEGNVPAKNDTNFPNGWAKAIDWAYDFTKVNEDNTNLRANMGTVFLVENQSVNYELTVNPFIPGKDSQADWKLEVIDPQQDAKAVVYFLDAKGHRSEVEINYYAIHTDYEPQFLVFIDENDFSDSFSLTNYSSIDLDIKAIEFTNDYYELEGIELPLVIKSQETLNIDISLKNAVMDVVEDYLIVVFENKLNGCLESETIQTRINISPYIPVITVDDIDYGSFPAGLTSDFAPLNIYNLVENGALDELEIYGFEETELVGKLGSGKVFEVDGFENVDEDNPLLVPIDGMVTINVRFSPKEIIDYNAKLVFSTNALILDSVSNLFVAGQSKTDMTLKRRWGFVKADPNYYKKDLRSEFEYKPTRFENALKIQNVFERKMRIDEIMNLHNFKEEAFLVKDEATGEFKQLISVEVINELKEIEIEVGETYQKDIYVHPKEIGEHLLSQQFVTNTSLDYIFDLEVAATVPVLQLDKESIYMGSLPNSDGELNGRVRLIAKNGIFNDEVTIYGFEEITENNISFDWNTYNNKNFKIDLPTSFPIVINKGETLRIDIAYKNNRAEDYAEIQTISDAEEEVKIIIIGGNLQSVEQVNSSDFSIYPNPASDYIEVNPPQSPFAKGGSELASRGIYKISITNMLGVEMSTPSLPDSNATPQEGNFRIDVSHLPRGVYFLRIGRYMSMFVKQ